MKPGDLGRCRVHRRWGEGAGLIIDIFNGWSGTSAECLVGGQTIWVNVDELEVIDESEGR